MEEFKNSEERVVVKKRKKTAKKAKLIALKDVKIVSGSNIIKVNKGDDCSVYTESIRLRLKSLGVF